MPLAILKSASRTIAQLARKVLPDAVGSVCVLYHGLSPTGKALGGLAGAHYAVGFAGAALVAARRRPGGGGTRGSQTPPSRILNCFIVTLCIDAPASPWYNHA